MTVSETTYRGGDRIDIGDGVTITLCQRKGRAGIRWTWAIEGTDEMGQTYQPTPEAAITDARKAMNTPECRHGERGWCPDCHDAAQ